MTRGLAALRAFRAHEQQKQVAMNFQQFSAQPKLVLQVFAAWRQFVDEVKQERKCDGFLIQKSLQRSFRMLKTYAANEKIAREKWAIACSIHI
mmetsp:Transcript_27874/g.42160  ORF Transcript_27874/g.42160 Transcript_27874/m.42160 type:complete len:93 (+) Transcript_27874:61-339(+)